MPKILSFIIKVFLVLGVFAIFIFLFYKNFQPTGAVVLDKKEDATFVLTPEERVIEKEDFKELNGGLVYFTSVVPERVQEATVRVWFKDHFPEGSIFQLGAKNKKEWSYVYTPLFEKGYDGLMYTPETLPKNFLFGSLVYNPLDIDLQRETHLDTVSGGKTHIEHVLRGKYTAYVYLHGPFDFDLKKQDLNWYANEDRLKLRLYKDEELLDSYFIEDDAINTTNQSIRKTQEGHWIFDENLDGVYRLEIEDSDSLITQIKTHFQKIVFPKLFLADNDVYDVSDQPITLYSYLSDGVLYLLTYHKEGLQKIRIDDQMFLFDTEDKTTTLSVTPGYHQIFFEYGDIIVSGNGGSYFSFTADAFFHPYRFYETDNPKKADYLILEKIPHQTVKHDGDWLVAETDFNLSELYLNEKRELSFVFDTPHLAHNETMNFTIPVKRIEIEYYQEPFFA